MSAVDWGVRLGGAVARASAEVESRLASTDRVFIYGAGQNGAFILDGLRGRGRAVCGFIDDIRSAKQSEHCSIPVFSLDAAARQLDGAVVFVSMFTPRHSFAATAGRLQPFGAVPVSVHQAFAWFGALPFYFVGNSTAPSELSRGLARLDNSMVSDPARQRLRRHLEFLSTLDVTSALMPDGGQFEPELRALGKSPTYVDGGAFDGDTIRAFLADCGGDFNEILAFEPDTLNFAALSRYVDTLDTDVKDHIRLFNAALWERSATGRFSSHGDTSSSLSQTGAPCQMLALDEAVPRDGRCLVKLDVEGAEAQAIRGMRQLVAAGRSVILASVYHTPDQIWEVPREILDISGGYRFDIRAHGFDGTDVVLTAYPPGMSPV